MKNLIICIKTMGLISGLRYALGAARAGRDYRDPEEYRCGDCAERLECPAYSTGVCYPCPYHSTTTTRES